jgi:hypothetical protein
MAPEDAERDDWVYAGFGVPTFTQIPDDFIDEVAPHLKEGELRVMLYIMRRTYGFGKLEDRISINQLCNGITTRDGRRLDWGTGMSRSAVRRGVDGCIKKGLLVVTREQSENGEYETNLYALRFRPGVVLEENHPVSGVVPFENHPLPRREPPGSSLADPRVGLFENLQETVQETATRNSSFEDSKDDQLVIKMDDRIVIGRYMEDIARELRDQAPLPASTTRACRLFIRSGMSRDEFTNAMLEARQRTQEHSGNITKLVPEGRVGEKTKLAYWFAVLEDVVGLRERSTGD